MFGFIKNILRKMVETPTEEVTVPTQYYDDVTAFEHTQVQASAGSHPGNGHQANGREIELPLNLVLKGLPLELQPRVRWAAVGEATISVPLEKILSQLSRGTVKISFGELRTAAPEMFDNLNDRDRMLVPLPLSEILARLNPALIVRRRTQRQVEVPAEIDSPFGSDGQGLVFSRAAEKAQASQQEQPVQSAISATSNSHAIPPISMAGIRNTITAAPTPQPPGAAPIPMPSLPASPRPVRQDAAAGPLRMVQPAKTGSPSPLMVGLTALAEGWPEAVRQEIVQLNLVDAKVGLPSEAVERALKQGRIAFTWKMLRSWIRPSPLPVASAHDGAVLELPLKVVAPLFLERQNEAAKAQQKVCIDENIPNLFFGFPQPEPAAVKGVASASSAAVKPPDTNYYIWDDSSDTVRVHESEVKRPATPGTSFVTRYATPNEIVSRAAALEGVAGALIALPDGLMVASQIAPELNGETLAAFLPQIFGKLSQCTKELKMGELNNLNFTVGNVPWKIFRVNAIFFAAFGRAGEPLPTGPLAAMAAELDHKPKQ
jgi:predicted regulator of Ras-like GTPase activity (Roadblock/LC7/MglB family)